MVPGKKLSPGDAFFRRIEQAPENLQSNLTCAGLDYSWSRATQSYLELGIDAIFFHAVKKGLVAHVQ